MILEEINGVANMISSVGHAHKLCIRLLIARFPQMILIRSITEDVSAHVGLIFFFPTVSSGS